MQKQGCTLWLRYGLADSSLEPSYLLHSFPYMTPLCSIKAKPSLCLGKHALVSIKHALHTSKTDVITYKLACLDTCTCRGCVVFAYALQKGINSIKGMDNNIVSLGQHAASRTCGASLSRQLQLQLH